MAKIRIYELARDLNMTNKVLLEKIQALDIPVKSHMSSLSATDANRIKTALLDTDTVSEEIEETRVKPTIIRRRKKVVKKETIGKQIILEAETSEEKPAAKPDEKPVEKTLEEKPAVLLKKPKKEEITEKEAPAEVTGKKDVTEKKETKIAPLENIEIIEPVISTDEKTVLEDLSVEAPPVEEIAKPVVEDTETKDTKKVTRLKAKKKTKKELPAKIIKLPIKPSGKKPPLEEKPSGEKLKQKEKAPSPPVRAFKKEAPKTKVLETDKTEKPRKKKKILKKQDGDIQDKKFFKKKISFKKKEVVEGADLYSGRKRGRKGRKASKSKTQTVGLKPQITTPKAIKRRIKIDDTIALSELAKRMGIKANEMIIKLMDLGVMATVNQIIDFDTATLVAAEFNYEVEKASFEEKAVLKTEQDDPEKLMERPAVVTVMGHVDHGKTSLLDVIRKTSVTEDEAGGITQHIGAYNVTTEKGQIVFLDTPGHEAFTSMRSRGASITDLVVLVVAADDGVMPQTIEAINHAKAASVPIIVAINKIDKLNAEPERVQRELAESGLTPEEWGGDSIFVKVSAKENKGIDELLEMILLQAEVMELKANPDKPALGHVVESKLDSGRGPVATVLIKEGTLHTGDPVVCGLHYGKTRSLLNDKRIQVKSAGPSIPVEVIGLSGVPMAGDELVGLESEKDAKQVSLHRIQKQRAKELAKTNRLSLDKLFERMKDGELKDLNLIIKADVHGSIEALSDSLTKLSNNEVNINIVHSATGTITESDVSLATVSDAIIIGFSVRPTPKVHALAHEENVDMRFYNIIYNVIKDVKDAILGMMSSTYEERVIGTAEVRQVFHVPKVGAIAGCYVIDGKIERGKRVRLLREGIVTYEGKIHSLRRFKDDVKEVQSGYECGIGIENYNDIKVGDTIDCFYMEEFRPDMG